MHIERARVGSGSWETARAHIRRALSGPVDAAEHAGLYYGAPALAFMLYTAADQHHAYQAARDTLDAHVRRLTRRRLMLAADRIARGEPTTFAEYNLFYGLTGIAALLLRQNPGDDLLADVLRYLVHALNKAALLASDCGLGTLAHELCWHHINIYRAGDGQQALQLLTLMYGAIISHTDLIIDGHTLPLTNLHGTQQERHKLREWVWLHLVGDGIRALALTGRWNDAVTHAEANHGIGLHLLEGRQAKILHHCLTGALTSARTALAESTPEHPWEGQVASCLTVICAGETPPRQNIADMIEQFVRQQPTPGYAVFRAQLGMTMTTRRYNRPGRGA
jgi:hypothetical protein